MSTYACTTSIGKIGRLFAPLRPAKCHRANRRPDPVVIYTEVNRELRLPNQAWRPSECLKDYCSHNTYSSSW